MREVAHGATCPGTKKVAIDCRLNQGLYHVPIDIMRASSVWDAQFIDVRHLPTAASDMVIVCTTSPESVVISTKSWMRADQISTVLPDPGERLVSDGSHKVWRYFGNHFGFFPEVELESHRKLGSPGENKFSTSDSLQGRSINLFIKGRYDS